MVSKATKRKVAQLWNDKCAICGAVDFLEYHHIIEKAKGGSDEYDNIILLCACCHAAIHGKIYDPNKHRVNTSIQYEDAIPILNDYFQEKIGAAETKRLLHLSEKTHLSESALVKRYKREHNITDFYNHVDIRNSLRGGKKNV
ncbi:HNH endonuclease [Butyrivibrio sp. FC2001]|uniref:HNH endonuclease n=1 Tax=Butyrivibrio sp. FC2001 TaxID=1280671 RepID=UPI000478F583|nr:HNH endonuclease [Butyrivibrio sp. FC2001]